MYLCSLGECQFRLGGGVLVNRAVLLGEGVVGELLPCEAVMSVI